MKKGLADFINQRKQDLQNVELDPTKAQVSKETIVSLRE